MIMSKTKLALGVAAMTGVLVVPQASAHSKAEKVAVATDKKVQALENQVNQMADMMRAMDAELRRVKTQTASMGNNSRVEELETWMASVKNAPVIPDTKDNMVFFRGGFARNDHTRTDLLTGGAASTAILGVGNLTNTGPTSNNGWYIGAGLDFSLDDNLWGLMDNTEVLAELGFEYKNFGTQVSSGRNKAGLAAQNPLCTTVNGAIGGAVSSNIAAGTGAGLAPNSGAHCSQVTVSQFTLSAAPKIKFMKGSKFRPWIIPAGLAIHVISPPSDGVTVFNTGVVFGGGADYKIWEDFYVGADVRYHLTGGDADGVDTDGFTAGGYLGIGF